MDLVKDKTFVICVPGRNFSGEFMLNLIDLISFISRNNGKFKLSVQYHPIVNASRCKCLGADVSKGKKQAPFNGIKYDYLFMRKTGDKRKDSEVKSEIYFTNIHYKFNVLFAIDDRKQVKRK